jgi:hypothetical protein
VISLCVVYSVRGKKQSNKKKFNYKSVLLIGTVAGSCEHGDEPSRSTKCGEFTD